MKIEDCAVFGDPSAFSFNDFVEMEQENKRLNQRKKEKRMSNNAPPVDDPSYEEYIKNNIEQVAKDSFQIAMIYRVKFDMLQKVGFDKSESFQILLSEISSNKLK